MIGDAGVKLFDAMRSEQRRRAKDWLDAKEDVIAQTISKELLAIASAAPKYPGPERLAEIQAELTRRYESEDQVAILKTSFVMDTSIELLRKDMVPIILRRTGLSKDPSGSPVLSLPPYRMITAFSPLRPNEQAGLDHVNNQQLEKKAARQK